MTLYHYTCSHAVRLIRRDGLVKPAAELGVDEVKWAALSADEQRFATAIAQFAWFTDLEPPAPAGPLGLTRLRLKCDRTTHCFAVQGGHPMLRWTTVRRKEPAVWWELRELEFADGAMPMHWYVSRTPVPVLCEVDAHTGATR